MNYTQIQMSPKYLHWTIGAKECYRRGGVCQGCETYELIGKECRMKAAVISLVKHCGLPPDDIDTRERENIINDKESRSKIKERKEEKMIKINANSNKVYDADIDYSYGKSFVSIIEAIKKGFITNKEIAEMSGIDAKLISVKYRDFYRTLTSKNLTDNLRGNTYLEKIIDFVHRRLKKSENYIPAPNDIVREAFTAREQEIVDLLLQGLNFKEICKKLVITMATFKSHLNNIYQKRDYHSIQNLIISESKTKSEFDIPIKRKTDADYIKELTDENKKLRDIITELEKQPKTSIDFDKIRHQIMSEIDKLNAKLQAIELLEKEFNT